MVVTLYQAPCWVLHMAVTARGNTSALHHGPMASVLQIRELRHRVTWPRHSGGAGIWTRAVWLQCLSVFFTMLLYHLPSQVLLATMHTAISPLAGARRPDPTLVHNQVVSHPNRPARCGGSFIPPPNIH